MLTKKFTEEQAMFFLDKFEDKTLKKLAKKNILKKQKEKFNFHSSLTFFYDFILYNKFFEYFLYKELKYIYKDSELETTNYAQFCSVFSDRTKLDFENINFNSTNPFDYEDLFKPFFEKSNDYDFQKFIQNDQIDSAKFCFFSWIYYRIRASQAYSIVLSAESRKRNQPIEDFEKKFQLGIDWFNKQLKYLAQIIFFREMIFKSYFHGKYNKSSVPLFLENLFFIDFLLLLYVQELEIVQNELYSFRNY